MPADPEPTTSGAESAAEVLGLDSEWREWVDFTIAKGERIEALAADALPTTARDTAVGLLRAAREMDRLDAQIARLTSSPRPPVEPDPEDEPKDWSVGYCVESLREWATHVHTPHERRLARRVLFILDSLPPVEPERPGLSTLAEAALDDARKTLRAINRRSIPGGWVWAQSDAGLARLNAALDRLTSEKAVPEAPSQEPR